MACPQGQSRLSAWSEQELLCLGPLAGPQATRCFATENGGSSDQLSTPLCASYKWMEQSGIECTCWWHLAYHFTKSVQAGSTVLPFLFAFSWSLDYVHIPSNPVSCPTFVCWNTMDSMSINVRNKKYLKQFIFFISKIQKKDTFCMDSKYLETVGGIHIFFSPKVVIFQIFFDWKLPWLTNPSHVTWWGLTWTVSNQLPGSAHSCLEMPISLICPLTTVDAWQFCQVSALSIELCKKPSRI